MDRTGRVAVPLRRRRWDLVFVAFFLLNITFITYIVDLESLVIADPSDFDYPLWPPAPLVDLIHWYGGNFDPLLMARPPFWRMTIWIDAVFFGPFYAFAIYAFLRGRDWIRLPALVWSGTMAANVLIILMEERYGEWATDHFGFVLALNAPWLLTPLAMTWRMRREHPFTDPPEGDRAGAGAPAGRSGDVASELAGGPAATSGDPPGGAGGGAPAGADAPDRTGVPRPREGSG